MNATTFARVIAATAIALVCNLLTGCGGASESDTGNAVAPTLKSLPVTALSSSGQADSSTATKLLPKVSSQSGKVQHLALPSQLHCLSVDWTRQTGNARWFFLNNSCAYAVQVRWCEKDGCMESTGQIDLPARGKHEGWVAREGKMTILTACQLVPDMPLVYPNNAVRECIGRT